MVQVFTYLFTLLLTYLLTHLFILLSYLGGRKIGEPGHTTDKYVEFLDFISKLLIYIPSDRTSADDALNHPYLSVNVGGPPEQQSQPAAAAVEHAASQPVTGNGFESTGNVPASDEVP